MSADDYMMIRNHPDGGYAVVRGFDSDPSAPEVRSGAKSYEHLVDAIYVANREDAEYGVSFHHEVFKEIHDGA